MTARAETNSKRYKSPEFTWQNQKYVLRTFSLTESNRREAAALRGGK
jgi:hypothetical protein